MLAIMNTKVDGFTKRLNLKGKQQKKGIWKDDKQRAIGGKRIALVWRIP